jgi:hypothetical protein
VEADLEDGSLARAGKTGGPDDWKLAVVQAYAVPPNPLGEKRGSVREGCERREVGETHAPHTAPADAPPTLFSHTSLSGYGEGGGRPFHQDYRHYKVRGELSERADGKGGSVAVKGTAHPQPVHTHHIKSRTCLEPNSRAGIPFISHPSLSSHSSSPPQYHGFAGKGAKTSWAHNPKANM